MLPTAYRQTLLSLDEASRELQDLYARRAQPHILGYSTLAATAGAIPVPWLDLLLLPGIQSRMVYHLARLYGQPLSAKRFLEVAGSVGVGMAARQAVRGLIKFIPYVGSVAGAALAGASTYALGKAFCFYYSAVHQGHVPKPKSCAATTGSNWPWPSAWGMRQKAAVEPEATPGSESKPPIAPEEAP